MGCTAEPFSSVAASIETDSSGGGGGDADGSFDYDHDDGWDLDDESAMDMDTLAAAAAAQRAASPALAAEPTPARQPTAGVRTRGVATAEATEEELRERVAALEAIQAQLESDLAELKESTAVQLGVLDPEVLHRAASALECEVDFALDAAGPSALFAGGELEGMTSEQATVARRANRLQQISASVIDRAIAAEPEIEEHLERSMTRSQPSKSRDTLSTKKRRAFVLLVLLARLRRTKDTTEVLLPWGLTIYLISLHSPPALVEGLRESLQVYGGHHPSPPTITHQTHPHNRSA